jgi:hypothetical protein
MKFGIHIGHVGGPLPRMRQLWKFADAIATLTAAAMDTFISGLTPRAPRAAPRSCSTASCSGAARPPRDLARRAVVRGA